MQIIKENTGDNNYTDRLQVKTSQKEEIGHDII